MFRPIDFHGSTHVFGAPKNWDETVHGKCIGLPLLKMEGESGLTTYTSFWAPTFWERIKLFFGAKVALSIAGMQPAVALSAERIKERV